MSLPVLTAVTGAWEAPLVTGLERIDSDVRVVRRCADLTELLAASAAGLARAVVLSADLHRLDRDAVAQLMAGGVAVVGLAEPGDLPAAERLRAFGVRQVLAADTPAAEIADAVLTAVAELARGGVAVPLRTIPGPALDPDPGAGRGGPARPGGPTGPAGPAGPDQPTGPASPSPGYGSWQDSRQGAMPAQRPPGRLVAVWGPIGAPGRTTVATTLAAELAAAGRTALLVDADTYGACVAQALGLLEESAGLAAAVRAANQGGLDVARLASLAPLVTGGLRVLTGVSRPQRWPELRASGLEVVWERARALAAWTVVDCGFGLEADEELSFDTVAPRRNGATLSALAAADVVLAVGGCDPVGLQRLVRGLQDLAEVLAPSIRPRVVVTRVRAGAVGSGPDARVVDALARYAGVQDPVLVPDDRPGCDEAMLAGRTLTEVVPASPARAALAALARAMIAEAASQDGVAAAGPARSRRRARA